ncbi:hypothetical protein L211DRAFT_842728 [Terfezia boudieri ATCC MYA-4762]|uniref:Uncharacterized protein n=1 Tax=Terfezia boudieri ATCC MYA-4762 TaxID=1051890 RepID=A0A3N4L8Z1_9PEZI|nr:hypothetical protein L211DRAFT_842728 [Terfezia boudieri ATCC MYA-4762]
MPAPPQIGKPLPPPGGLRRGVPMVQKGSSPPAARLGRRGVSPQIKGVVEKGQSLLPVSREQSPAPRKMAAVETAAPHRSLSLENVSQGRPRSNTDAGSHPPYGQISRSPSPAPADFRPQVPKKDFVRSVVAADHVRSRSLSPSAHGKEKPERRKNVFGLFPSEKKEKDESNKRGMADHIAAVFHRKVSNQSAPQQGDLSFRSTPTPQTVAMYNTPPFGLSPPHPWITSASTPPINQFGWHQRNNSSPATSATSANSKPRQTPRKQHSRDNSSSTNASASQLRNPSRLAKQASFDIEAAIEKVWGPIEGTHHPRPVQRGSGIATSEQKQRPTRSQTPPKPISKGRYLKPSPLLPPLNKETYQKRTLPPAPPPAPAPAPAPIPAPAPAPAVELYVAPVEQKPIEEREDSPVSPLRPVAYNPYEPASPASPGFEPLLPISMIPLSPRCLSSRVSHRLSVSIPSVGRPVTQRYSVPGTPAELFKATSASHEHMYYLELPTGLGEFHLDSAIDVQQEDEDDILVWLDSLKFENDQGRNAEENIVAEEEHLDPTPQDQPPQVVIDAASPAETVPTSRASTPAEVGINVTRPRSPSFIPRKPVGSAKATAATTVPPTPPTTNPNLLSPPIPQLSPPSPSDYSGSFSDRISFSSTASDVFKNDVRYSDELPLFDWRSSGEFSDYEAGDLRLQNVPAASNGVATSSVSSSPQTQPSTTFSSPNLSEYSVSSTGTPSSGGLCTSDIDAILGSGPSKLSHTTTHVYIPDVDDGGSEGMRSSEIEAILRAQMVADEEEMERRRSRVEKEREDVLEREYLARMERRRTRYVRGRNSGLEGDILFVLRGEDII